MTAVDNAFSVPAPAPAGDVLLRLTGVKKHFPITKGIVFKKEVARVHAVDGVDLELRRGETLGLVGETGCGKSTLARVIIGLHSATAGTIEFEGNNITNMPRAAMRHYRREMQMV